MSEQNKRRVLLVNASVYLPGEGGYKRTMYMFDLMKSHGYQVTLATSDFNHYTKQQRNESKFRIEYPDYSDIVLLHMPKYSKNVSVKRYYAEKYWSHEFKKWFRINAHRFDIVLFSDIDFNLPVDKICDKHGIKKLVDIRDLRPEVFKLVVKNELLYNILFFPMKLKANRAYACADELIAVSQEYLDRGLQANKKSKNPLVVYIGSTFEKYFDGVKKYSFEFDKSENEIWVTYVGTLGESYDLFTLLDTAKHTEKKYGDRVRFKILGQGPLSDALIGYCNKHNISNVDFLGFLPYEKMAAFLCKSDITVNAIKKNASQSIINKVADYLAAGIPMLNGCVCREQWDMVEKRKIGLNYEAENSDSMFKALCDLIDNPTLRRQFGENALTLALEKFDRKTTYPQILKLIDEV